VFVFARYACGCCQVNGSEQGPVGMVTLVRERLALLIRRVVSDHFTQMHKHKHKDRKTGNSAKRLEHQYQANPTDQRIHKYRLTTSLAVNSTAAGIINQVISMNPATSSEWGTLTSLYDQFRVMGIRIRLVSCQQYSVTAKNDLCVICYDNDNSTALTSVDAGQQYDTSELFSPIWSHVSTEGTNRSNLLEFVFQRPSSGKNTPIDWLDAAVPANSVGSVKFYSTNLTVSTQYMSAAVDWYVEFRGRN